MEPQATAARQGGETKKTVRADARGQSKSGGRAHDFSNVSDTDDVITYEEGDSAEFQLDGEFYN